MASPAMATTKVSQVADSSWPGCSPPAPPKNSVTTVWG